MALKKEIKVTEARILVYLSQVSNNNKSLDMISAKLGIDYSYCIRTLKVMVIKGWVFKHRFQKFMYYDLTGLAPTVAARESLCPVDLQAVLDLTAIKDKEANTYERTEGKD